MIKVLLNNIDVSSLISSVVWSGNDSEISRTLNISYLYAIEDYYTPKIYPNLGDTIYFYYDDFEIFRGKVYIVGNEGMQGTINLTCYEDSIKLSKSKGTFNFKNTSAETITEQVLKEVGIEVGQLAQTSFLQKSLYDSENLYTIIKECWENVTLQNGKNYINFMYLGKFYVIETGQDLEITLDDDKDIISVSYSEDASNIINRVKIYDDESQYSGVVEDSQLIDKFGVFQEIYTKEEDKNANTVAKEMLQGIEQSVSIMCIGNYRCISGYCINVKENKTKLFGKFEITSDSHTWENGNYKMSLELKFIE